MSSPQQPSWSGSSPPYTAAEQHDISRPNGGSGTTTTEVAKDEAAGVARSASEAAQHVGSTAKEQVGVVASDVKEQGQRLAGEARQQLGEQATTQRDRAAKGIRAMSQELHSMAEGSEKSGLGTQLVRQVASSSQQAAGYLESREPAELLEDLRSFARRRPGTFLLGAALAGVVAGRLTRGLKSASSSDGPGKAPQLSGNADLGTTSALPPVDIDPEYPPAAVTPVADSLVPPTPSSDPYGAEPYGSQPYGSQPYASQPYAGPVGDYPEEGYTPRYSQPAPPPRTDPGYGPVSP